MISRIFALILAASLLSGCIATPRIEFPERFSFDYVPATAAVPMSYADLLCCDQCAV